MFTGIIESVGRVESMTGEGAGRRMRIAAPFAAELCPDQSVAVDGVCLTVVAKLPETFEVDVVAETFSKTNLSRLSPGADVNLERALPADGRVDGHFVQGHVDATGQVTEIAQDERGRLVSVRYPSRYSAYLIPVGSVALDGISFTVARLSDDVLTVAVIPHTWKQTTMRSWDVGRAVNLEFDLIGKYVVRALERGVGGTAATVRRFLTG